MPHDDDEKQERYPLPWGEPTPQELARRLEASMAVEDVRPRRPLEPSVALMGYDAKRSAAATWERGW
jgi:hypothetical protein